MTLYTPRKPDLVIADIKAGTTPPEFLEQYRIADVGHPAVKAIVDRANAIAKKLIDGSDLSIPAPTIMLSDSPSLEAFIMPDSKHPPLVLSKELLMTVRREDELAGVIAHELGHRVILDKTQGADSGGGKAGELTVDGVAVGLLIAGGYNPRGLANFLGRIGNGLNINELFSKSHPQTALRTRAISDVIVGIRRANGYTGEERPYTPLGGAEFRALAWQISWQDTIETYLKDIGYRNMSTLDRMKALEPLIAQNGQEARGDEILQVRCRQIARAISKLDLNAEDGEQIEVFQQLLTRAHPKDAQGERTHQGSRDIQEALHEIWLRDIRTRDWAPGRGTHGSPVGRYDELRIAIMNFHDATTLEAADRQLKRFWHYAMKLILNCAKEASVRKALIFFMSPTQMMFNLRLPKGEPITFHTLNM